MSEDPPLTAAELAERLEYFLDPILSARRTADGPAAGLSVCTRAQQEFVLHWVGVIVKSNSEMGYQFAANSPRAWRLMDDTGIEAWLIHAMDIYDKQGLYPACEVLERVDAYARQRAGNRSSQGLKQVSGILQRFARGLAGRDLKIETSEFTYTDTQTLFLPATINRFDTQEKNFRLYKAMTAFLWAQTWYGTFRPLEGETLGVACARYDDPDKAVALFHALETARINTRIDVDLGGLARDMRELQGYCKAVTYPSFWAAEIEKLRGEDATVASTYAALASLYPMTAELPERFVYQGALRPEQTEAVMQARQLNDRASLGSHLAHIAAVGAETDDPEKESRFTVEIKDVGSHTAGFELNMDNRRINAPGIVYRILRSINQDFGRIPEEYLIPAGDAVTSREGPEEDSSMRADHGQGAYLYNEWDCRRRHYRKDWCVLRELDVPPVEDLFVAHTLSRYRALVGDIRKTFEALRGEDRLLKKQSDGDDLDLDAVVESISDAVAGLELSDRVFSKRLKQDRDLAVIFMVDMSGSTKGWINDAEREALVLLCEAIEVLGDRYAIYGFSGMTRKRCELYRIKQVDEHYGDTVKSRIAGIKPRDYTRMGVIIRHLTAVFRAIDARTKLLITLSDGKPDDYDGYRGEYGIEDTRQALIEAKYEGVHPFCITIDDEAGDYLPRMYGAINYVLVDDVRKLPTRIADIYRRLTT